MRAQIVGLSVNPDGRRVIVLTTRECCEEELEGFANKDLEVDIKIFREKRSLRANGYMWLLCEKLAEAVQSTKEEVYRKAIREVGCYRDFEGLDLTHTKTLETAWARLGLGWFTERVGSAVRCYYGSSEYDAKQMARLLDYVIADCEAVGIPTLPEAEIDRLKREWRQDG